MKESEDPESSDAADRAEDDSPETASGDSVDPVRLPIESCLDLHSFRPEEVASVVEEYLEEALSAGFREIRIVHGRGIGVQREIVRTVLARTPWVTSFQDAPPERGGWGATLAWLSRRTMT